MRVELDSVAEILVLIRTHVAKHEDLPSRKRACLREEALALYDERFCRMWEFYLCYCEGGFIERTIGTAQLLLAKPAARPAPLLGNFNA